MGNFNKNWYDKHLAQEDEAKERAEANALKVYRGKAAFAAAYPDNRWLHYVREDEILLPVMKRWTCIEPGFYCARILTPAGGYKFWDVLANNGDDSYIRKKCQTEEEAKAGIELLVSFAPASFNEIVEMNVGFKHE